MVPAHNQWQVASTWDKNNNPTRLVNSIVLGKPYPGQAPKSNGGDIGANHTPCHAILLAELGCAGWRTCVLCLQVQWSLGWVRGMWRH